MLVYSSWLIKMHSPTFYTLSGNNLAVLLIHLGHSCYIVSTAEVHSKYSNTLVFSVWILKCLNRIQQSSWKHSECILTAFVQHLRHLPTTLQAAILGQKTHMTFKVLSYHYHSILNIPTVFQIHVSCVWGELIHWECAWIIWCRFVVNS